MNVGEAAEELVLGDASGTACGPRHLVAIRSREAAQGNVPANGDGDALDAVLVVYDFVTDTVYDLGQAVTPCRLEACDPSAPYRVHGGEVRFLTFESEQGQDLDGNGAIGGLVLQSFDVCTGVVTVIGGVDPDSTSDPLAIVDQSQVFTTTAGRCALEPAVACAGSSDVRGGHLLQPAHRPLHAERAGGLRQRGRLPARGRLRRAAGHGGRTGARPRRRRRARRARQLPERAEPAPDRWGRRRHGRRLRCRRGLSRDAARRLPQPGRPAGVVVDARGVDGGGEGQAVWKWTKGAATSHADFGDPLATDAYRLCLYGSGSAQLLEVTVPPGGTCAGKPCWKRLGSVAQPKGYQYANKTGAVGGVTGLKLRSGPDGKAKITLTAKGSGLGRPPRRWRSRCAYS